MLDKKPEDPTEILAWKNSLELMANEAINKLISASMEKGSGKQRKGAYYDFCEGIKNLKIFFGDTILFPDGYRKEDFINTLI